MPQILWALHQRYYPIFRSWPFGEFPSFGYDWKKVFRQVWIDNDESRPLQGQQSSN
jgi:hypothetical protein